MSLRGKNIIVGVTGGIAAYKIPLLVRLLKKSGADVKVILTPSARDFVSPLTLSVLSGNAVLSEFTRSGDEGVWNNHVALAAWADLMLFAPVTAHTLSKMASGQVDNLLMAVYLSAKCPVMIAPAMDLDMYAHPATRKNLQIIQDYGHYIIPATEGELASGLTGYGRMEEPENIFKIIERHFKANRKLEGKTVLVTAGPTYEAIDPVRFIGNHSSGKMGIAIAEEAARRGAKVVLVLGPTSLTVSTPDIKVHKIVSAEEMYEAVQSYFDQTDICVMAAAVADFTPENKAKNKIKKTGNQLEIKLKPTRDILASLGKKKSDKQVLIGFAMETQNERENALKKLQKKNLDFIVLNSLNDKNAGFKHDTNKVTIFTRNGKTIDLPLKSKKEIAGDIIDLIDPK